MGRVFPPPTHVRPPHPARKPRGHIRPFSRSTPPFHWLCAVEPAQHPQFGEGGLSCATHISPPPPKRRPPGVRQTEGTSVHLRRRRPSQPDRLQLRSLFSSRRLNKYSQISKNRCRGTRITVGTCPFVFTLPFRFCERVLDALPPLCFRPIHPPPAHAPGPPVDGRCRRGQLIFVAVRHATLERLRLRQHRVLDVEGPLPQVDGQHIVLHPPSVRCAQHTNCGRTAHSEALLHAARPPHPSRPRAHAGPIRTTASLRASAMACS